MIADYLSEVIFLFVVKFCLIFVIIPIISNIRTKSPAFLRCYRHVSIDGAGWAGRPIFYPLNVDFVIYKFVKFYVYIFLDLK